MNDKLREALDLLDEIVMAGMSGTGSESPEAMNEFHARQAWKFISAAAQAKAKLLQALAASKQEPSGCDCKSPDWCRVNEVCANVTVTPGVPPSKQEPQAKPASEGDMKVYGGIASNYLKDVSKQEPQAQAEPESGERAELIRELGIIESTEWQGFFPGSAAEHRKSIVRRAIAMLEAQPAEQANERAELIRQFEQAVHRKGELWERCQGKGWPQSESDEFRKLRDETIPTLRAAMLESQPAEQEKWQETDPCGWMRIEWGHTSWVVSEIEWGKERPTNPGNWLPLYTTPPAQPAREWALLTDDDVTALRSEHGWAKETIRAIESKLREKNARPPAAVPDTQSIGVCPEAADDDHPLMHYKPAKPQAPDMEASE